MQSSWFTTDRQEDLDCRSDHWPFSTAEPVACGGATLDF